VFWRFKDRYKGDMTDLMRATLLSSTLSTWTTFINLPKLFIFRIPTC